MSTNAEYEKAIAQYNRDDLLDLWKLIEKGREIPEWESGKAFEYLILRAFQIDGVQVRWPYDVKLGEEIVEQIDGVVYIDTLSFLIECKDQSANVNFEPIAKLRSQLIRRPAGVTGVIFSRSEFTAPAVTLARFISPQTILLWSGAEVNYALQNRYMKQGLIEKYQHAVEHGLPDYDIQVRDTL